MVLLNGGWEEKISVAKGGSSQTDWLPDCLPYQGSTREEIALCATAPHWLQQAMESRAQRDYRPVRLYLALQPTL
jgi:hypothetical protein